MRKTLAAGVGLAGLFLAFASAGAAQVPLEAPGSAQASVQLVQYYEGWHDRHEYWRAVRHARWRCSHGDWHACHWLRRHGF